MIRRGLLIRFLRVLRAILQEEGAGCSPHVLNGYDWPNVRSHYHGDLILSPNVFK
jgi:hypothetical protein